MSLIDHFFPNRKSNSEALTAMGTDKNYFRIKDDRVGAVLKRYKEIEYPNGRPHFLVSGFPVEFDPQQEKIGINVSGGADSAFLLFVLAKMIHDSSLNTKIVPISVIRNWETARHLEKAKEDVFDYIERRFPNVLTQPIMGFLPSAYEYTALDRLELSVPEQEHFGNKLPMSKADAYYFFMFNRWAARKGGLKKIYNATTTNPPEEEEIKKSPAFRSQVVLDVEKVRPPAFASTYREVSLEEILPFHYLEKSWITAQFKNFAIEDLLALTRSCEVSDEGCQDCFHCQEREWSFQNHNQYLY